MFSRIYSTINEAHGTLKCLAHFQEELGEVSEMIRFAIAPESPMPKTECDRKLRQELADLFAWYCGVINRASVEVEGTLKEVYGDGCPECHARQCVCDPYHVHSKVRLSGRSKT